MHIYEFADFRLISSEGLLLHKGEQVALAPKAFSTLVLLVQQHGRLVEKKELIERVWEDAFVEEAAVSRCVWSIRVALGEDPKNKKFIQTVPKRGYRFVGDVTEFYGETIDGNSSPTRNEPQPLTAFREPDKGPTLRSDRGSGTVVPFRASRDRLAMSAKVRTEPVTEDLLQEIAPVKQIAASRNTPRLLAVLLGVIVLVGFSMGAYFLYERPSPKGLSGESILAVLPLKPVSAENRDPIVEFAVAESLILKMSSATDLHVRPLSAVRKYVELDHDPIDAGIELKADYVLSSNYQIVDGKIRVTSQLFDTRTGRTESTFKSESIAGDKFAMQDAIANEIGDALFVRFGRAGTIYTAKRGTTSEEAYRLYIQGQYLVDKKTGPDAKRAIEIFDEALTLDPNFAHAWAGKAGAHCTFAHMGGIEPRLAFITAKPALSRAFELDPNLAEAHAVLGVISFDYDWEFEKGLKHFRKAFEINPQHEMARRWYANRLALLGRYDEALTEINALIDINPSGIFQQWDYAHILYQASRYDEAIIQIHRVLEMDPNMAWAPNLIWVSYHMKGDSENAYTWFIKFQESIKSDSADIAAFKTAYATKGWKGVLVKHSETLRARYKHNQYDSASCPITLVATLLGDYDTAFKFVGDALKHRDLWIPFLLNDPAFEPLKRDPRFEKLLRDAGVPTFSAPQI